MLAPKVYYNKWVNGWMNYEKSDLKNGTYVLDCEAKWGKGFPSICSLGVSAGATAESETQSLQQ